MSQAGPKPSEPAKPIPQKASKPRILRRILKIAAAGLLGLLLLCAIGFVIYLKTLDVNIYKPLIEEAVLKASGRGLTIDGKMGLSISLHPSLTATGVHLANPPGFSRADIADIGRMQIEISLLPLLSGELHIKHIVLFRPDILLETKADGSDNWDFSGGTGKPGMYTASEAKPGSPILIPQIHRLTIRDAKFAYRNAASGQSQSLSISRLNLWQESNTADAPLHLSAHGEYDRIPIRLQGKLGSMHILASDEPLSVALHAEVPGAKLKVNGQVAHPLSGSGMVFNIDLSTADLGTMGELLHMPPAMNMPLHLATTLTNTKDGFDLQNLHASLGQSDLTGNVHLAVWQPRPSVGATLQSNNVSLKELLPAKPPQAGSPANASGRLLPNIPFDLQFLNGFDADVAWKLGKLTLPEAELTNVDARLTLNHGVLKIAPFKAGLAGGDVQVQALLQADKSPPKVSMVFNIDLPAAGLGTIGKLLHMPPAMNMPLHLATTLTNTKDGFDLQNLHVSLGQSDLAGNVHLAVWQPRPSVDATLQSNHVSLKELLPAKPPQAGSPAKAPGRLLPNTPFDLQFLNSFDADIAWKLGKLTLPEAELTDVDARLTLNHGVLKIAPFKAGLAGGDVQVQALLQADQSPPKVNVVLTGRHINSGQLLSLIKPAVAGHSDLIQGAALNADVKLAGSGSSVANLLAGSNGRIKLQMGRGKIRGDTLNLIGGDLMTTLVDKLNPLSKRTSYMDLQCGVVNFRVDNGMMVSNGGIAFETKRTNLLSHGKINLHNEHIDLSIGTQPRGGIGVNLSNMVNVVRLGGTLAKPRFVVDVTKTGEVAARAAGAVMTGGLSLLGEGFFDRITADKSSCKTALAMK